MVAEQFLVRYLDSLLKGDRTGCRGVIEEILQSGIPANMVYMDVIWPIILEIERLFKSDKINSAQEHMSTRINRTIVDQLQNKLPRKAGRKKKIAVCSAATVQGELGGQMMADLFESDGWHVRFLGGGVSNDDMLAFVHEYSPDVLLIYGTVAQSAPGVRRLIDTIKEVNALPGLRIMVSGGVFNRAEGLWEEIGADLFATDAGKALKVAAGMNDKESPEPNRSIRRRKKNCRRKVSAED